MAEYVKFESDEDKVKGKQLKQLKLGQVSVSIVEGTKEDKLSKYCDYAGSIILLISAIVYMVHVTNSYDFSNLEGLDLLLSKELWLWFFDLGLVCAVIGIAIQVVGKKRTKD